MAWLFKVFGKYTLIAVIWLVSVVLVITSERLMNTISVGLDDVFGLTTPFADQKKKNADQKKNNSELKKKNIAQRSAMKKSKAKSKALATKMVTRNVMDAGSSLVPIGGAVVGVGFAAADIYAACELIDIQNELGQAFGIPDDKSVSDKLCLDAVAYVDALPELPDLKAPEWELPDMLTISRDGVAEFLCNVTGDC